MRCVDEMATSWMVIGSGWSFLREVAQEWVAVVEGEEVVVAVGDMVVVVATEVAVMAGVDPEALLSAGVNSALKSKESLHLARGRISRITCVKQEKFVTPTSPRMGQELLNSLDMMI